MRSPGVVRTAASLLLAVALAGLAPMAATAATHTVRAGDGGLRFAPASTTIPRGDRIVWDNVSTFEHDVTSRLPGYFRSAGHLGAGERFGRTFSAAGTFGYYCMFHVDQGMTGNVTVPLGVSLSHGLFTIRVAAASSSGTVWRNRVQVRTPGSASWRTIATTTGRSVSYDPGPHGTYRFRSAVRNKATGAQSGFSPVVSKVF
jgi:plastocyanin